MVSELPTFRVIGGACANSRYQALSSSEERPGIEAMQMQELWKPLYSFQTDFFPIHDLGENQPPLEIAFASLLHPPEAIFEIVSSSNSFVSYY